MIHHKFNSTFQHSRLLQEIQKEGGERFIDFVISFWYVTKSCPHGFLIRALKNNVSLREKKRLLRNVTPYLSTLKCL